VRDETSFAISVCATPRVVGVVREFIATLSERVLGDRDVASQAEIAIHELLDNATRYATDGEASVRVELRERSGPFVTIRTRNRVTEDHARRVAARIDQLRTSGDPMRFYVGLMGRNKERSGGLGLGRVAAESEMTLEMAYTGDVLEVAAVHVRGAA
jgi:anti-sigma regulatory factor (Ser/Thr protein kinase)